MGRGTKPLLLIIPGIGDHTRVYDVFAIVWRALGYEVHIVSFGWEEYSAPLVSKQQVFGSRLDAWHNRPMCLIGISAGGSAAVNAFASRPNITKVIAVCSPLKPMPGLRNPLLVESILATQVNLQHMSATKKQRILSVYGIHDQVVNVSLSQAEGVHRLQIKGRTHAPNIFAALTKHALKLQRFLATPKKAK